MKDFDATRSRTREDRTFRLAGETFVARAKVRPEKLIAFDELADLGDDAPISETMRLIDEVLTALIDPADDALVRYQKIRESEDPEMAVGVDDLRDVLDWLMEVITGRPTGSPSDSTSGRESTGTSSTEDSSSQAIPEALPV